MKKLITEIENYCSDKPELLLDSLEVSDSKNIRSEHLTFNTNYIFTIFSITGLLPLLELHSRHAVIKLSYELSPPLLTG